jgi:hypothetical protein
LPLIYLVANPPKLGNVRHAIQLEATGGGGRGIAYWTSSKTTLVGWEMRNSLTAVAKAVITPMIL